MKKVRFKRLFVFFLASILASTLCAQQPVRKCATVEYNKQKEQSNSAISEARQRANQLIERYLDEHPSGSTRNVITIPVVVHIIYNINIQNISDAQVLSQIDVLNRDFGRLNADTVLTPSAFSSIAVNTGIQFCLATRDPNGNPTTGIERRQNTAVISWSPNDDLKEYVEGGLDAWPRSRYLNIWVCNLSGSYLGFTQLPGNLDSIHDGVVITSRAFGDTGYVSPPFHLGRTTTHEVGHWLGLKHLWADDGGACPWDAGGNEDQISDTPAQASETTGCPSFPDYDACSPNYPGVMFMNYMDYTDDACMNMFTQEQSDHMNAVLNTIRSSILTSDGCVPVGVNEIESDRGITVYPNPVTDELYVISYSLYEKSIMEIYDMVGRSILSQQPAANSQQHVIDVSSLAAGSYFLKITSSRSVLTARFTIAR